MVTFSLPYLLNEPYAGLRSKVGFIFGSLAFCALVFTYFCIPECKQKSLEEINFMFHERVPIRKFGSYQAGAHLDKVAAEESGVSLEEKPKTHAEVRKVESV